MGKNGRLMIYIQFWYLIYRLYFDWGIYCLDWTHNGQPSTSRTFLWFWGMEEYKTRKSIDFAISSKVFSKVFKVYTLQWLGELNDKDKNMPVIEALRKVWYWEAEFNSNHLQIKRWEFWKFEKSLLSIKKNISPIQ